MGEEVSPAEASAVVVAAPSSYINPNSHPERSEGPLYSLRAATLIDKTLSRHFLQLAIFRGLISPEPHEHRCAQFHATLHTFVSPLRKLDFSDNFGTHELNLSQSADLAIKRILFRLERLQAREDFFERSLVKAGADLANVNETPLMSIQNRLKKRWQSSTS